MVRARFCSLKELREDSVPGQYGCLRDDAYLDVVHSSSHASTLMGRAYNGGVTGNIR